MAGNPPHDEEMILRGFGLLMGLAAVSYGQWYVGGMAGLSTLSADGQNVFTGSSTSISSYKPENGAAVQLFAGRHWREYFSTQGSYSWNRNALKFSGTRVEGGQEVTFEQARSSRQNVVTGEGLIYFRPRASRFRPYVLGGLGMVHAGSAAGVVSVAKGRVVLPPERFSATRVHWRTAVGMDVRLKDGWRFRYSFWENLSANPFSKALRPKGTRNLLNFQNMFGVVREF